MEVSSSALQKRGRLENRQNNGKRSIRGKEHPLFTSISMLRPYIWSSYRIDEHRILFDSTPNRVESNRDYKFEFGSNRTITLPVRFDSIRQRGGCLFDFIAIS